MLVKGHLLTLVLVLLVVAVAAWGLWRWSARLTRDLSYPKMYWRPVLAILILALGFLGARSSLGHRGLNTALVAFAQSIAIYPLLLLFGRLRRQTTGR